MTAYALFLCFAINGRCNLVTATDNQGQLLTLEACESAKRARTQTYSLTRQTPDMDANGYDRRGMKYTCMTPAVPAWSPTN